MAFRFFLSEYNPTGLTGLVGGDLGAIELSGYLGEMFAYTEAYPPETNLAVYQYRKLYVVNKLVSEIENAKDAKARIAAISKLGEVDGVDAFKKRTEMTVKVQPIEEVEKELLETLAKLERRTVDVEMIEVVR